MSNLNSNISLQPFLDQFDKDEKSFYPAFRELKKTAIGDFQKLGFPTTRNEEWKYTNVSPMLKNDFLPSERNLRLTQNDIVPFLTGDENVILLVFENGIFNKGLSTSSLPSGIIAGNIGDYTDHPAVKTHLTQHANSKEEGFVALNTALFQQGAFLFAEKNINCAHTFHFLFVNDAREFPTVNYPRNLVVASHGNSLKIVESYHSIKSANSSFCNSVTEIFAGENSNVEFSKIESENENDYHIDYTSAEVLANSTLNIHTVTYSGKLVRNNLRIELKAPNANAYLNGLFVTDGETHVDNHSFVDHASPNCYSNELYKGVLGGKSHGVFNGKIFVRRDAQKTNAYQSNKNILLSNDASMNAKPQLEIYADDVKCSHGATTGQLDYEALFYLRSRGIGASEARAFLTIAFAEEILDKISNVPLREKLKEVIHSKLQKGND